MQSNLQKCDDFLHRVRWRDDPLPYAQEVDEDEDEAEEELGCSAVGQCRWITIRIWFGQDRRAAQKRLVHEDKARN